MKLNELTSAKEHFGGLFEVVLNFNNLQKGHEALVSFGTSASSTIVEEPTVLLMCNWH